MKLVQVVMEGEPCNLSLDLGLGSRTFGSNSRLASDRKPPVQLDILFPEMEEGRREEAMNEEDDLEGSVIENKDEDKEIVVNGTRDSCNNNGSTHKKLRLTKVQSLLLEDSFRKHPTLSSTQKHDLAKRLNLFPRQVEVWFQNKRARTKLKQTEVAHEYLKKICENLRDENWKLKRELQELRSVKPLYMQVPKARALTVCPSCERIMASDDAKETAE